MREHPILFSAPMVRAILDGRKTQTRRPMTGRHDQWADIWVPCASPGIWESGQEADGGRYGHGEFARCPYGSPGDRLWVRETWAPLIAVDIYNELHDGIDYQEERERIASEAEAVLWNRPRAIYRATDDLCGDCYGPWRPSIHMPRWASRLTLEVTGVRVERVQEISEEDALAEGIQRYTYGEEWGPDFVSHGYGTEQLALGAMSCSACDAYARLWDRTYASRGHGWDVNPWVWVVEFRRVEAEVRRQLAPKPDLDRCLHCSEGILDARLGGMCGDYDYGACPSEVVHG